MKTIKRQMEEYFQKNLRNEEYIVREKAATLMYYIITGVCVVIPLPVIFVILLPTDPVTTVVAVGVVVIVSVFSLVLLRKGRYNAADLHLCFITIVALGGQFSQTWGDP